MAISFKLGGKKMKEIKFEEVYGCDGEWHATWTRSSSDWKHCEAIPYGDYTLYLCWDNEDNKILYRNKNKKTCDKCGAELKE